MQPTSNLVGVNQVTTLAGIAAGTTSTVSIANDVQYSIGGKGYKKSATSNITTPTTDAVTAAAFLPVKTSKACVFVYGLDSSGALKCAQGSIVSLDGIASSDKYIDGQWPQFPVLPDSVTPFGYLVIKAGTTASSSGWVQGTNNMAAVTGITYTFVDIFTMPDRPQTT